MTVGRCTNDAGVTIATLVNYACHPTTLAWDNTLISPDYPGAMREIIETATSAPCLFIQGASGDIGPKEGFTGDTSVADRNGRQLGYAALSVLQSLPPSGQTFEYSGPVVSGATIGTWKYRQESAAEVRRHSEWRSLTEIVSLKYRADLPTREQLDLEDVQYQADLKAAMAKDDTESVRTARAMLERTTRRKIRVAPLPAGEFYPYSIGLWRIGSAIWVALDGEHYNVLQRSLRERFPDVALIIGTLANGSTVWYLPDSPSYGLGLYEEEVSVLAQGCLEAVLEATASAIKKLI